ncbi:non-ribosomal peptide synthetase [Streptomyces sp. SID8375]|uniref:non-ribosomal peptide synthetase n=1 Tax=unclassified Streptomyces TaxID=2593676 RepID=UPI000361FCD8|nr:MULTISPECIES: non-ribosomal peptide synthetase [unclassified Streptomyces]MYX09105.1 non-ribosomal peptide synthetase [Streptomyces sp. SID8375]
MTQAHTAQSPTGADRRELLRSLLNERAHRSAGPQPASQGQRALWTFDQLHPDSPAHNLTFAARVEGRLDTTALRTALRQIVDHHAGLRTTLMETDGEVRQRIASRGTLDFTASDLTGRTRQEVDSAVAEFSLRPFDLANGPLLRACTIRHDGIHILVLSAHHVAMDLWAFGLLIDDLQRCYPAAAAGERVEPAHPGQGYLDFVRWQTDMLKGEKGAADAAYWERRLSDAAAVLDLPTDRPRPAEPTYLGSVHTFRLDADTTQQIRRLSQQQRTTPYAVLLSAFNLLMHRWTGQDDICVGSVASGRSRAAHQEVMGYFSNLTVLRTCIGARQSFRQLVNETREMVLDTLEHQDFPFPLLAERLSAGRSGGNAPLFNVAFYYESASWSAHRGLSLFGTGHPDARLELGDLTLRPYELTVQGTEHDLSLFVEEVDGTLCCSLRYATDLFDRSTARRLAESFATLTRQCLAAPDSDHAWLRAVPDADRRLQAQWSRRADGAAPDADLCAHHLVLEQAARTPDAPAVVHGKDRLTYRELVERATGLAVELQSRGVGPDVRVGLSAEGSLELVVGMLAVLMAGGAYVPLDPGYPHERLTYMLENSRAALLLTLRRHTGQLPLTDIPVLLLDEMRPAPGVALTGSQPAPDDLAYVIYTSGTTGKPKGAMITHRGLVNLDLVHREALPPRPGRRVLQFASISFDYFTWEWMLALTTGGSLHVASREQLRPGPPLIDLVARERITTLNLTAGVLSTLDPADLPSVIEVTSASEPCSAALVRRWARDGRRMVNAYGPTEVSVFCTTMAPLVADGSTPPIGHTVPGTELHVLDERMQPVPVGAVGELYIGGLGVGRGYQSRPDITADRFVPDPFSTEPGQRLYRSGDRVRWGESGVLHYLGRTDHQVKIRGVRIEPGEIEAVLAEHPDVRRAVVLARPSRAGDLQLVAYVMCDAGRRGPADAAGLRGYLAQRLPAGMVPAFVVVLDKLPLNPNGKLDRRRLPEPDLERSHETLTGGEPRTSEERAIADIWREVLGVQRIGIRDNFFELGGHSLLATRVAARLRDTLGVELPLRELFDARTVEALAARVGQHRGTAAESAGSAAIGTAARDGGGMAVSFAQRRLWFLEQLRPGDPAYHVAGELRLSGELDVAVLRSAMVELVRRHEVLRTVFTAVDGEPRQVVGDVPSDVLPLIEPAPGEPWGERSADFAAAAFDLAVAPLRAALVRVADTEHVLLLAVHHIAADGWSMRILLRELAGLYTAFLEGRTSPLPPLRVQYADFAAWQRRVHTTPLGEESLAYWQRELAGSPPALELPTDFPRAEFPGQVADHAVRQLNTELAQALTTFATRNGATLSMVLLTAFTVVLSRWAGQHDVLVGMPVAGRGRKEVEDTIGLFVNTVVIRTDTSGDPTFTELLEQVRRKALEADAHQDVPFEELVERLAPKRDMSRTPVFQVMFNMRNLEEFELAIPGVRTQLTEAADTSSKFDLTLYGKPQDGRVDLELVYSTELFAPAAMHAMLEQVHGLLIEAERVPDRPIGALVPGAASADGTFPAPPQALPSLPWTGAAHEKFLAAARRDPHRAALFGHGDGIDYGELDRRSAAVAGALRAEGVRPGDRVVVHSVRCAGLAVALLGVLRAGACFVILDRGQPAALRTRNTETVAPAAWLEVGGASGASEALGTLPAAVLHIDTDGRLPAGPYADSATPPLGVTAVRPQDTAYLAFTSGSTGVPKAVAGPHGPLAHFIDWYTAAFEIGPQDRFALTSGLGHDPLLRDLFLPLAVGASVQVPRDEQLTVPEEFAAWLEGSQVTVLHLTPPTARFLSGLPKGSLPSLRYVFFGGDVLSAHEVEVMRRLAPGAAIVNFYGATETPQAHAYYVVEEVPEGRVPLGRGIDGSELLVLRGAERAAVGELGEIAVRSAHLATGYVNDPEATELGFSRTAHTGRGESLYRTGDLGRLRADGTVMFAGRADRQVKVRGHRVEPAETEAVLRDHEGVADAVVLPVTDSAGETVLHGYVVAARVSDAPPGGRADPGIDGGLDTAGLRAHAAQRLPGHLVPAAVSEVDAFPLTRNGKIDEHRLRALRPAPQRARASSGAGPAAGLETRLVELWQGLLQVEHVGREDNFFDLGGHSLLVVRLQSLLHEQGLDVTVVELFRCPTVAALARALGDAPQDVARNQERTAADAARNSDRRAQRRRRLREAHSGGDDA